MCALLASTEKIIRIIHRGLVYEMAYGLDNTPQTAFQSLEKTLIDIYSTCLELLMDSSEVLSRNTAARTVHAILFPKHSETLFSTLVELERNLSYEVQACESGKRTDTDNRLALLLRGLDAPLARVDERVCALLERVDDAEQRSILTQISNIPYGKYHNEVKESRTPGTYQWLLQHDRFRE
jgi:hypothetical protein